jgi:GTPase involved in cell partitioning and DNA repair
MVNSNSRPAEVIWNYDRLELIADGIVHAIGIAGRPKTGRCEFLEPVSGSKTEIGKYDR